MQFDLPFSKNLKVNLPHLGAAADLDPDFVEYRERLWERRENRVILSLFDHSGAWSAPWREAGYTVISIDIKEHAGPGAYVVKDLSEIDAQWLLEELGLDCVYGVIAAPPCTHFASSGAQYWPAKDADGRTDEMLELVYQVFRIVDLFAPKFWAMENPVGRLPKLIEDLGLPWYFQPHQFGDAWTKKTGLWGRFCTDLPKNGVAPTRSWGMDKGGSSEATKEARSVTPSGFARAFWLAND